MQSDCCILSAESYLLITEISACIAEHYYINIWAVCGARFTFTLKHCMQVSIYIVNEYRDRVWTSFSINIVMCEMITSWTSYQNRNYQQVYTNLCLSGTGNESQVFETSCTSWMICLTSCTCVNQSVWGSRVKQYTGSAEPSPWA